MISWLTLKEIVMEESRLPHKFEDCISLSPHLNGSNDIVIYSIDDEQSNNQIQFPEHIIPCGYLYAAELIVDTVYKKYQRPITTDDKLALPFLSLHFCSLEFCLKLLKKKLENHQECNTCQTINKMENKKFHNHDLYKLGEFLKEKLPKKNKIHSFNDFDEILNFIKKLNDFGINLESVRYIYDKYSDILPLHKKKTYIELIKLHNSLTYISKRILNYISDRDFELCEQKSFSQIKLNELKYIKSIMDKHKASILDYNKKINAIHIDTTDKDGFVTHNLNEIFRFEEEQKKLFNESPISTLEHKELAALVMGLYFYGPNNYRENLGNLSTFESWEKNDLEKKILDRLQRHFQDAYSNLCGLIKHIEATLIRLQKDGN